MKDTLSKIEYMTAVIPDYFSNLITEELMEEYIIESKVGLNKLPFTLLTLGDYDSFYDLSYKLNDLFIPYVMYPRDLRDDIVVNKYDKTGKQLTGYCDVEDYINYYLEEYYSERVSNFITLKDNWDNQVKNAIRAKLIHDLQH